MYFAISFLITVFIAIIVIVFLGGGFGGTGSSKKSLDPNRTKESCSFLGEAQVIPSGHSGSEYCITDGDGYWHAAIGHHHHK